MSELKTIDIKGKSYVMVHERLQYFRDNYKDYSLETKIIEMNADYCVLKAIIKTEEGRIIATGLAREVNGDTFINKTSYVENAETSAWGRALANFGIGLDISVASAEEVQNAIANQNKTIVVDYKTKLIEELKRQEIDVTEFAKKHKISSKSTQEQAKELLEKITNGS